MDPAHSYMGTGLGQLNLAVQTSGLLGCRSGVVGRGDSVQHSVWPRTKGGHAVSSETPDRPPEPAKQAGLPQGSLSLGMTWHFEMLLCAESELESC